MKIINTLPQILDVQKQIDNINISLGQKATISNGTNIFNHVSIEILNTYTETSLVTFTANQKGRVIIMANSSNGNTRYFQIMNNSTNKRLSALSSDGITTILGGGKVEEGDIISIRVQATASGIFNIYYAMIYIYE